MSNLFISPSNEYPRYVGDILIEHPDFDGVNLPTGWQVVEQTERPPVNENEIVYEIAPELVDGYHKQSWAIRSVTEEEIERRNNHPKDWEEAKKLLPFNFN
jgi:hypothetical protein